MTEDKEGGTSLEVADLHPDVAEIENDLQNTGDVENSNRIVTGDVVDWTDEDDPEKPLNWTNVRKAKNIVVICYCTFLT